MNPRQPQPVRAVPTETHTRWGVRLFAEIVARLPQATPPAERRLLRTAYTIHRMVDETADNLTDGDLWRLVHAVDALKATARDACAAGVDEGYVRRLVAMTTVAAGETIGAGLALVSPEDMPCTDT